MGKPYIGAAGKPLGVNEVVDSAGTTERYEEFVDDNGRAMPVRIRFNIPEEAYATQEADYDDVNPDTLTEPVERDIAALEEKLSDFTHYDREGQPVYTLTGRARQNAELQLGTLKNLSLPHQRREAERIRGIKKQVETDRQERQTRIFEKAQKRAQEMAEEAEVEQMANALKATMRSGV